MSARTIGELKYCNSLCVFNNTIIPLTLVGYEIVIGNEALRASLAIYHLISNAGSWKNFVIILVRMLLLEKL